MFMYQSNIPFAKIFPVQGGVLNLHAHCTMKVIMNGVNIIGEVAYI